MLSLVLSFKYEIQSLALLQSIIAPAFFYNNGIRYFFYIRYNTFKFRLLIVLLLLRNFDAAKNFMGNFLNNAIWLLNNLPFDRRI